MKIIWQDVWIVIKTMVKEIPNLEFKWSWSTGRKFNAINYQTMVRQSIQG